jgi:hypothetical protein
LTHAKQTGSFLDCSFAAVAGFALDAFFGGVTIGFGAAAGFSQS